MIGGEPKLRDAAATYLNQKLFVYGGVTPAGVTVSDVHTYTPAAAPKKAEWKVAGSLSAAAAKISAARVGEQVLLVGGVDGATILSSFAFFQEALSAHELAVLQLHGSGTTNPSRFFRKWMNVLESRILFPTHVTYRAVGSGAGQSDFQTVLASGRPSVDYACGDIPLSTAAVAEVTQNQLTEVLHIPFALGSISVFHNIPGVPELKLRACTIAKIFSGAITTWDHADVKADIGATTADLTGKPIKYAVRKGGSSSSFGLSEYLKKATAAASQSVECKASWAHVGAVSANFPGPLAGKPAGVEVEGSSKMTSFLKNTEYSIGYLDSGHGIAEGLSEVQLEVTQTDGTTKKFQASSKADVAKAAVGITPPAGNAAGAWTTFSLQNKNGAWPITMVSYFYVRRDLTGLGSSGSLLKAFIEHIVLGSEGQTDAEARYGFVALPTTMLAASKATAAMIKLSHDAGKFTLESDTLRNGLGMGDYVISKKRNPKPLDVEEIGTNLAVLTKETKAEFAALKSAKSAVTEVIQGALPTKLSDAAAVHFRDGQYVFGGCVSGSSLDFKKDEGCTTATDVIYKYNPTTHAWDVAAKKLTGARFGHTAVVFNNKVYLVGGSVNYIETISFDAAGTLTTVTQVPVAVVDRKFGAAAVHDGKLHVCGGLVGGSPVASCSLIDAANAVTVGKSLVTARSNFVLVSSGTTLFAFGGVDGNDRVVGALETLTGAGDWTAAVIGGEPKLRDAAATYLNQKLFVYGGVTPAGVTVSDVHTYTPAAAPKKAEWKVAGSLSAAAAKISAARVGEQVLLVGGVDGATILSSFAFFQEALSAHELAVLQLHGSGTTNPSRFFRKWMNVLESRILFPTHVTYRAVGSGAGQSDFQTVLASGRPSVDYACGDIPLSTAAVAEVTQNQLTEVLHIPFALGSISVFHNIPGVPELKLRACTIAKIFSGAITTWDHADVKADIGATTADLTGKPIKYAVRKGGSSSSFGLSEYLKKATAAASQSVECKASWAHVGAVSANFPGPLAGKPAGVEVEGSSKMTSFLKNTEYSIGYLDSGHGIAEGLSEVQLEVTQTDGTTKKFQASSKADVAKAAVGITPPAGNAAGAWTTFSLQNKNGAWPITMVSYFYVRRDLTGLGSSGSLLKAFIEHIVLGSEGQADAEARYGFVALPTTMLAASKATAAMIKLSHDAAPFTLESDTLRNGLGMGDYVISKKRNPKPLDVEEIGTNLAVLTKETKAEFAALKSAKSAVTEVIQGALPTKLSDAAAVHFRDGQYVFGGCVSGSSLDFKKDEGCTTATDVIYKYNPTTHAWDVAAKKLTGARFGHTAVVFNNKVYLVGGSVNYIETISIDAAGTLTVTQVPTAGRAADVLAIVDRKFGAAAVHDGKLHVCGGLVGGSPVASCSLIDAANAVTVGKSLVTARSNFVLVSSGTTLFAFGGVDGNDKVVGALETLTGVGSWTQAVYGGEPKLRDSAAAYLNQKLYIYGGVTPAGVTVSDVHTYTPATTTWKVAGSLSAAAAKITAVRVGEQVLLVGGLNGATVLSGFTFFKETPALHELAVLQLHGSGTTNPSRFFRKWMNVLESRILFPTHVTYRAVGSGAGQSDFQTVLASGRPSVDYACGDIPLSTAAVAEVTQNQLTEVLHIPFALGSISVFHNIPGVPELKLRACTIAKIFSGAITTWDHADVKADIGATTADLTGKPIKYAVRKGGSSSSFGLSEYLKKATNASSQSVDCKASWEHVKEVSANFPGPLGGKPAGVEVEGSSKMTSFLKNTEYSIGYLDSGHGIAEGLSEVQLEVTQTDGTTKKFQASSKADVAKAAVGITPPAGNAAGAWTTFSLQNTNGAWPITMVSYFYVRRDLTGLGSSGSLLKAFIEHIVLGSEGQADAEARYGFVALPEKLLNASKVTAAMIKLSHDAGKFTLESDTLRNGLGMGDYVISKKRNPKPLDVEEMKTNLALLEARVASLEAKLGLAGTLAPPTGVVNVGDSDSNDNAKKIAVAGLVFAIVALIVSLIAVALIFVRAPSTSTPRGQVQCPSEPVMSEPNF